MPRFHLLRPLVRPRDHPELLPLQTELARLWSNVNALLSPAEVVLESTLEVEEDEVVMTALFGDTIPTPDPSCAARKCHRSDHTSHTEEARQLKKKEDQKLEVRALLMASLVLIQRVLGNRIHPLFDGSSEHLRYSFAFPYALLFLFVH
uniref:Uncharacterized protein n=1 Tax=Solanum tuberosum TaxID=4113 RepID=M1DQD9_SOLTU